MLLADIPSDSSIFVDANIFIYHFADEGDVATACTELLLRVEEQDIKAFASTIVLSEVLHRLMIAEAVEKHGLPLKGIVRYLKKHPDIVAGLKKRSQATEKIQEMGVTILPVLPRGILDSADVRASYGLLINDSIIVPVMNRMGLSNLATNDGDFERVTGLRVWKPVS